MQKYEFEKIAGYEVSNKDYYEIIEPMYMATNLPKYDFVKCLDKKRFALKTKTQLIKEMKKIASHLHEICGHYKDYDAEEKLGDLASEITRRFYGDHGSIDHGSIFERGYENGCSYPCRLKVIGRYGETVEMITLV